MNLLTPQEIEQYRDRIVATTNFKSAIIETKKSLVDLLNAWVECENADIIPETECPFPFDESLDDIVVKFSIWANEITGK